MEIILVSHKHKNISRLSIGYWKIFSIGLLLIVILLGIFHEGTRFTKSQVATQHHDLYIEREEFWKNELSKQQEYLAYNKRNTEKNLDVLYAKMSNFHAQLVRLDILGSRLATMANISDVEYDMLNPPGLGGPTVPYIQDSICSSDFIDELHTIDQRIKEQNEKFYALESIELATDIESKTVPQGNPADGHWMSSPFGWRTDPISGKKEFHRGLDLVAKSKTNIVSVADGIVTWVGQHKEYGNMVEISHGKNYATRYAHNKGNLVSFGDKVVRGQKIAVIGSTGRSTGVHLHFEVLHNGKNIDPRRFIETH